MNQRFSLWKTVVVIVSLVLGMLYGLPNGFPDDPAVQITPGRSTEILGELDLARAENALNEAEKEHQIVLNDTKLTHAKMLTAFEEKEQQLMQTQKEAIDALRQGQEALVQQQNAALEKLKVQHDQQQQQLQLQQEQYQ